MVYPSLGPQRLKAFLVGTWLKCGFSHSLHSQAQGLGDKMEPSVSSTRWATAAPENLHPLLTVAFSALVLPDAPLSWYGLMC